MKSPFSIFRKNQKVAMAVLGILVMFAFVVGPALQDLSSSGGLHPSFWAIISAVFGAAILGGIGYTRGRAKEYAMTGFILGAVLGVAVSWYTGPAPAVESKLAGNLTEQELRLLIDRKRIANQFLYAAYDYTISDIEMQLLNNPQFARFIEQQRQQRLAPFYFQDASDEANVLQTFLMNHEAEQMGITVSNETINDYIEALTLRPDSNGSTKTNSLTPTQFHAILKRMRLDEGDLFDALREEIKAKMAMELIAPPNLTTPDQYWQSYQKLNVRQELDAVALNVEAFTADISYPLEGDLTALFSQSRDVFPNQNGPGKPGFLQPRRITLEYLEADYASAEEEILHLIEKDLLTPKESEAELNNERLRIDNAVAEVDKKIQDGTIKKEDEIEEKELAGQSEILKLLKNGQEINRLDFEIAKYYEDKKNFFYRNRLIPDDFLDTNNNIFGDGSFFPDSETSSDMNQLKQKQDDSESSGKQRPSSQKPSDDPQKKESSPGNQSESGNFESPSSKSKNPSEPKKEKSESGSALLETEVRLFQVASFLDDADEPHTKSDAKQNTDQNDASKSGEEKKTPAATDKTIGISLARGGPAPPPLPESPARRGPAPPPLPEDPPLPRYRPLDAELKNEIREDLIDQKTTKLVNDRVADVMGFMQGLEDQFQTDLDRLRGISIDDNEENLDKKQADQLRSKIASRLKQSASEKSLVYGETKSLSYAEFLEPENQEQYPIASAGIPNSNSLSRTTIIDRVFSSSSEVFSASQAVAESGNQFAYWKTEDIESFIPESLDEPGIREQVLHAWKMGKAREKVQERAKVLAEKVLAEIVRNSETEMSEALKEETLTGKEGDIKLTVQPTESFSWLEMENPLSDPSNPFGQQQTARIWVISTIEKAGNDFMRIVFEELQDGDVGVAPNFDHSIYYVVKVKNRSTSVPGSLASLKQGFQAERFNNIIYYSLNQQNQQTTASNWSRRFYEEKYNLKRNSPEANR